MSQELEQGFLLIGGRRFERVRVRGVYARLRDRETHERPNENTTEETEELGCNGNKKRIFYSEKIAKVIARAYFNF